MNAVTSRFLFSKQVRVGLRSTATTTMTLARILSSSGSNATSAGGVCAGIASGCSRAMTTTIPFCGDYRSAGALAGTSTGTHMINNSKDHYPPLRRYSSSSSSLSSCFPSRTLPSLQQDVVTGNVINKETANNKMKQTVITKWGNSKKYWMSNTEYAGIVVGREATNDEYIISDGIIGVNGFVPNHYHKWEDQTFHVIEGTLVAQIGDNTPQITIGPGDTIHCPRNVTHYIKNIGNVEAKVISYIFPGTWAEEFMAETSRQNHEGKQDFNLIEEKFGVVYVPLLENKTNEE